jgi:hypothetical protein
MKPRAILAALGLIPDQLKRRCFAAEHEQLKSDLRDSGRSPEAKVIKRRIAELAADELVETGTLHDARALFAATRKYNVDERSIHHVLDGTVEPDEPAKGGFGMSATKQAPASTPGFGFGGSLPVKREPGFGGFSFGSSQHGQDTKGLSEMPQRPLGVRGPFDFNGSIA